MSESVGIVSKVEWVHSFIHTLDEMLISWYVSTEFHREITSWEELTIFLSHTFHFADTNLDVHNTLQLIHDVVLKIVAVEFPMEPHAVDDGML